MHPETNWFATCRASNLEIIGPILGYFLRTKAENFCRVLSPKWSPINNLVEVDNILSICHKAVIPSVVELSVAKRTAKELEKFTQISIDNLNAIKADCLTNESRSRKIVMHEIRPEYHDWAWACLRSGDVAPLRKNFSVPTPALSNAVKISVPKIVSESMCTQTLSEHFLKKTRSGRIVRARKFFE